MSYPQFRKDGRHYPRYCVVNGKGFNNTEFSSFWHFAKTVLKLGKWEARDLRREKFNDTSTAVIDGYHIEMFYVRDRKK